MSDTGELFEAWRKDKQVKKLSNKEKSTRILIEHNIYYESSNGIHLIIKHNKIIVDFWPSTGKFIFRKSKIKGRGVFNLLKKLGVEDV